MDRAVQWQYCVNTEYCVTLTQGHTIRLNVKYFDFLKKVNIAPDTFYNQCPRMETIHSSKRLFFQLFKELFSSLLVTSSERPSKESMILVLVILFVHKFIDRVLFFNFVLLW